MAITPKKLMFVKEYLVDLNGTQAAIRAGYSPKTANEQAARLLADVSIQELIQKAMAERSERTEITADYVLETIKDTIERCRQVRPVTDKTGKPIIVENEEGKLVPAFSFDASSVLKGCDLLGKNLMLWKDTGSKDNPLEIKADIVVRPSITREEWLKIHGLDTTGGATTSRS